MYRFKRCVWGFFFCCLLLAGSTAAVSAAGAAAANAAPAAADTASSELTILGEPELTRAQMVRYIEQRNPQPLLNCSVEALVNYYYYEGALEGVRPDVAICQAIKETDQGAGVLILTDMFGGTPSNTSPSCSMFSLMAFRLQSYTVDSSKYTLQNKTKQECF